jgi:hypothetical protein
VEENTGSEKQRKYSITKPKEVEVGQGARA